MFKLQIVTLKSSSRKIKTHNVNAKLYDYKIQPAEYSIVRPDELLKSTKKIAFLLKILPYKIPKVAQFNELFNDTKIMTLNSKLYQ